MASMNEHRHHDQVEEPIAPDHDPDPRWALDDLGEDDAGRRRIRLWVIAIAVLIVLALLIQLGWPLVMDLLDRERDTRGFPTPGVI